MKYTTKHEKRKALWIILILASVAFQLITAQAWKSWDVEYPMVNRNVEWSGAGYNGIWEAKP